ncbi:MAG: hypothetical protein M0P36_01890 [Bacteroidales bacterium]|nr:hypothetical protein [Bacteroidales bacterium]
MLEDRQGLIYTNMAYRFSLCSKLEDSNHELHEFTRILASCISLRSMLEDRQGLIYTNMASRFSLCSKLEGKQPRITRIYTNFGFLYFATLNARR